MTFNLSEKRRYRHLNKNKTTGHFVRVFVYEEKDVKEFINRERVIIEDVNLTLNQKLDKLDKLAGNYLVK